MRLILCSINIFIGALLFATPNLSRRELLFAVPVPSDFRETRAGRRAISTFRLVVAAAVLAGVCALLFSPPESLNATAAAVLAAMVLASGIGFSWQHRKLAPAAVLFTRPREAELTAGPEELPRFAWFTAGPFVILAAAAIWLHLHWERIPARFVVHFDAAGHPNRWAERTTRGVYGILMFGAEFCAWLAIAALASWFGSRRSHMRSGVLGGVIAVQNFLGLVFVSISLRASLGVPVWPIVLAAIVIPISVGIAMANRVREPEEPMDPTPNACWKAGLVYYNPDDAALFVEQRVGLGYTFNFANRWCWALLTGLALVIASVSLVTS